MNKFLIIALIYSFAFLLISCEEIKQVEQPKPVIKLAWDNQEWTYHLIKEIESKEWSPQIKNHCKKLDVKTCLAQALSIMAKYESGFKPETKYTESFKDAKGQLIISRGLFQLSIESANQSAYKCGIKQAEELHDPFVNITCMVKIAHHWLNKDLIFFSPNKLGLSRYHSVARPTSRSHTKILTYLNDF